MAKERESQVPGDAVGLDRRDERGDESAKGDVQERADEANEQGFYGEKADPTPNENYSLESGGAPEDFDVPEVNPERAREAFVAARLPRRMREQ